MTATIEDNLTEEMLEEKFPCFVDECDNEVAFCYHHLTVCKVFICTKHAKEGMDELKHMKTCPAHLKSHVDCTICGEKAIPIDNVRFTPV